MAELVDAPDSKSGHFLRKTTMFSTKFNPLNFLRRPYDAFQLINLNASIGLTKLISLILLRKSANCRFFKF